LDGHWLYWFNRLWRLSLSLLITVHIRSIRISVIIVIIILFAQCHLVIFFVCLEILFLELPQLFGKLKELILGKQVLVDQLILLPPTSLEVLVVLVAPSRWINTGVVHVLVPLHFVQGLKHKLTVLGADPGKPVHEVLVNVARLQEK
jgi:hypothetical protein